MGLYGRGRRNKPARWETALQPVGWLEVVLRRNKRANLQRHAEASN
mgnify:CR=1